MDSERKKDEGPSENYRPLMGSSITEFLGQENLDFLVDNDQLNQDEEELNRALEAMTLNVHSGEEAKGSSEEQFSKGVSEEQFGETYDYGLPPSKMFEIPSQAEVQTSEIVEDLKTELRSKGSSESLHGKQGTVTPPSESPQKQAEPLTPPDKIQPDFAKPLPTKFDNDLDEFNKAFEKYVSISGLSSSEKVKRTLVILSPLSYNHVFSRTWVPKKYLSSIVERPQRLMACSLGISTAMTVYPANFQLMSSSKKVSLQVPHVVRVHGSNWSQRLYQLCKDSHEKLQKNQLEVPDDWNYGDIYLAPDTAKSNIESVFGNNDTSSGTIEALEGVIGAVEEGVDHILGNNDEFDRAFVAIRPPGHHSHACVPSGFCLINNVHIAIQYAAMKYGITHAVILDFDLHHGDGSQDLCWKLAGFDSIEEKPESTEAPEVEDDDRIQSPQSQSTGGQSQVSEESVSMTPKSPKIGYFSIHDINSFPTEVGYATAENIKNASVCLMAHDMCIWNIHLEPYGSEQEFNQIYESRYKILFDKARLFLDRAQSANKDTQFKSLVIISAGFDASEYENVSMQRHQVTVPTSFFHRFTEDCVDLANQFSSGKVLSLLEGGYSDAALATGVFSHLSGLSGNEWDGRWCDSFAAKEFEKGCKLKYNVSKKVNHDNSIIRQVHDGIRLGRELWPNDVKHQVFMANSGVASTGRNRSRLTSKVFEIDPSLATPSRVLRDRNKRSNFDVGGNM